MALTEVGEKFLARAMLIREMIEEAREDAAEQGWQPSGLLRMTAATGIGEYVIAPNLGRFKERFPKVGVELILTSRKVDLIAERIDLAVRLSRPVVRDHIVSKLSSIRYCIGASPDYVARHPDLGLGDSADPRCLANHDCLLFVPLDLGPLWRFRSQKGGNCRRDCSEQDRSLHADRPTLCGDRRSGTGSAASLGAEVGLRGRKFAQALSWSRGCSAGFRFCHLVALSQPGLRSSEGLSDDRLSPRRRPKEHLAAQGLRHSLTSRQLRTQELDHRSDLRRYEASARVYDPSSIVQTCGTDLELGEEVYQVA